MVAAGAFLQCQYASTGPSRRPRALLEQALRAGSTAVFNPRLLPGATNSPSPPPRNRPCPPRPPPPLMRRRGSSSSSGLPGPPGGPRGSGGNAARGVDASSPGRRLAGRKAGRKPPAAALPGALDSAAALARAEFDFWPQAAHALGRKFILPIFALPSALIGPRRLRSALTAVDFDRRAVETSDNFCFTHR